MVIVPVQSEFFVVVVLVVSRQNAKSATVSAGQRLSCDPSVIWINLLARQRAVMITLQFALGKLDAPVLLHSTLRALSVPETDSVPATVSEEQLLSKIFVVVQ